jgi:hypothetical protein
MGAVLAMKQAVFRLIALAGAISLTACGSAREDPLAQALGTIRASVSAGSSSPKANPTAVLTPSMLADVKVSLLLAEIENRKAFATLTVVGQNGAYRSWRTGDGVGLNFRGDLLTGTRGLGLDLLTADVTQVAAALKPGGPDSALRMHHFLDGEGHEFVQEFTCRYDRLGNEPIEIVGAIHVTKLIVEKCAGDSAKFENRYWIGASDGVIWKSRQWVSERVGTIVLQQLVRRAE